MQNRPWLSSPGLWSLALVVAGACPVAAQTYTDKGPGSSVRTDPSPPAQPAQPAQLELSPEEKAKQEEVNRQREAALTRNKAVEANNKGVEFQKESKNSEAMKAFKEALTIDPSYELARQNLAVAYYNLGGEAVKQKKWAEAIEHYEAARTYDKSMRERTNDALSGSYNNQAAELVDAKRLDEAVTAMEKAAELSSKYQPELVNLKNYRDQLASQQKNKEKAKPAKPAKSAK